MEKIECIEFIKNKFNDINIHLLELQAEKLYIYYDFLVEKNKVMNLTAITEFEDVVLKHFIDSCLLIIKYDIPEGASVLDLGTGAGFPGIPLKIVREDLKITLADSLNKRINFLNEVIEKLELKNIDTVHSRAEDLARDTSYREQFDFCVSRAVANLSTLSEYCIPFVKVGGFFVSYKSGNIEEELVQANKALNLLGGEKENVIEYSLPDSDISRSLIFVKKVKTCSKKYPRKSGVPSKTPLC
ncbi:MAG: 16S rRNA (guanine(527)-N(7))-methyltransferase RsmG [Lachnospiraceae bacterium]|nr:16S rRNA (guanine(527)-N(7))-methyltransferase RsmG [Lachnospiraceae bacterium]